MELLKKIAKKRLILLVTHEEDLVKYYCDAIIEIVDGKVTNITSNDKKGNYDKQDKNDIYLGDFKKTDVNNDLINMRIELEITKRVKLMVDKTLRDSYDTRIRRIREKIQELEFRNSAIANIIAGR